MDNYQNKTVGEIDIIKKGLCAQGWNELCNWFNVFVYVEEERSRMKKLIDILFNLFCKKDMKTYSITEEDDEVDYDYENYPFYEDLIKNDTN